MFLILVPPAGVEPTTSWFEARRSIQLSYEGTAGKIQQTERTRFMQRRAALFSGAARTLAATQLSYEGTAGKIQQTERTRFIQRRAALFYGAARTLAATQLLAGA